MTKHLLSLCGSAITLSSLLLSPGSVVYFILNVLHSYLSMVRYSAFCQVFHSVVYFFFYVLFICICFFYFFFVILLFMTIFIGFTLYSLFIFSFKFLMLYYIYLNYILMFLQNLPLRLFCLQILFPFCTNKNFFF